MDKLPPELLHNIFIQLDLQERLDCLTICRRWWRVLDKYSLFHSIVLENEGDRFSRFMDIFKRLPDRAAQVEELYIVLEENTPFNRRKLFQLFPNAHKMEVIRASRGWSIRVTHFTEDIDLTHSKSIVQSLSDFHHCELVSQMLHSNLGGRLETLCLNFIYFSGTPAVISRLKDLPVLKTLTLQFARLQLDDLEVLHKNIPSIQSLALDGFYIEKGSMPSEILPASSITRLEFCNRIPDDPEMNCLLYQYMTKKYSNITEGKFDSLEEYYSTEMKRFYLNGYLDFLKLIGPTQNKLALSYVLDGIDPFEVLDAVGSKIHHFRLFRSESEAILDALSRSNQYKYVQQLELIDIKIDSTGDIIRNMMLTELTIGFIIEDVQPVDLVDCLDACPSSLKSLSIEYKCMVVKPHNIVLESIENLNIRCDTLTGELGDIISYCFPNLVKLRIEFKSLQNTNIALKSPQLQQVSFSRDDFHLDNDDSYGLSFKSANQTETQHYLCDELVWECVQFDDIQHLPTLSLTSFTKQKLDLEKGISIVSC